MKVTILLPKSGRRPIDTATYCTRHLIKLDKKGNISDWKDTAILNHLLC